jgi:hypothetical protein
MKIINCSQFWRQAIYPKWFYFLMSYLTGNSTLGEYVENLVRLKNNWLERLRRGDPNFVSDYLSECKKSITHRMYP